MRAKDGEAIAAIKAAIESDTDECILWQFYTNPKGYGQFGNCGTTTLCHRHVLLQFSQPYEDKTEACHRCKGNPNCINPKHLYWGSRQDNIDDKIKDGTKAFGANVNGAKLTEEIIQAILTDTRTQKAIAQKYGINQSTVSRIKTHKRWQHLFNKEQ